MTEQEWFGTELWRMLHHLYDEGLMPLRKQFLYCIEACRLRGDRMPVEYHPILAQLEALADDPELTTMPSGRGFWRQADPRTGKVGRQIASLGNQAREVERLREAVLLAPGERRPWSEGDPRFEADESVSYALLGHAFACSYGDGDGNIQHSVVEAALLRELFANPFRPVIVVPSWLTTTVVALAQSIYDEKGFDRMPILADALQEAGCGNEQVLTHCRSGGPHVRGCWVVDLLLGKE
jgi:hypothetical protein